MVSHFDDHSMHWWVPSPPLVSLSDSIYLGEQKIASTTLRISNSFCLVFDVKNSNRNRSGQRKKTSTSTST